MEDQLFSPGNQEHAAGVKYIAWYTFEFHNEKNRKRSGPVPRPPSKEPDTKVQRNFTDPDSRVLLTKDGFIQGYNAGGGRRGQANYRGA
jgi:hypothetical protein